MLTTKLYRPMGGKKIRKGHNSSEGRGGGFSANTSRKSLGSSWGQLREKSLPKGPLFMKKQGK